MTLQTLPVSPGLVSVSDEDEGESVIPGYNGPIGLAKASSSFRRRHLGSIDPLDVETMRGIADDLTATVQRSVLLLIARMTPRTAMRTSPQVQTLLQVLDQSLPGLLVEEERPSGLKGISDTETVAATLLTGVMDEQKKTYAAQRVAYLTLAMKQARENSAPQEVLDRLQAVLDETMAALAPPKAPPAPEPEGTPEAASPPLATEAGPIEEPASSTSHLVSAVRDVLAHVGSWRDLLTAAPLDRVETEEPGTHYESTGYVEHERTAFDRDMTALQRALVPFLPSPPPPDVLDGGV